MDNDQKVKEQVDDSILAGDQWLRQNGIVSDITLNTIIAFININYPKTQSVELDLDKSNQVIYVRVYLKFWTLVWLMLLGRRQQLVDEIFVWLCDYLPTYQVSVSLVRSRQKRNDVITPRSLNPDLRLSDLEIQKPVNGEPE